MEVISCNNFNIIPVKTVVALGTFDGIHKGHQALFSTTIELAKSKKIKSAVYTFNQHPLKEINPGEAPKTLMDIEDKQQIIKQWGFDYLFLSEFNKKMAVMDPETFIKKVLVGQINVESVVVGTNYHFGKQGLGNITTLKEMGEKYNFTTIVVKPVIFEEQMISSTRIRMLLTEGMIQKATYLLGRNYSLKGVVVHGFERGRNIGFPTANLNVSSDSVIPQKGIYKTLTYLEDGREFQSVTNIGQNPTFGENSMSVETFIINFDEQIYGQKMSIVFVKWLRSEMKFESVEQLIRQIEQDVSNSLNDE
jgi:riboflavin kinase/FMN adenylyltransferase